MFLFQKQPKILAIIYFPECFVMLFFELGVVSSGVPYIARAMRNIFIMVVVILVVMKGVKISETSGSLKKNV
jgi:hypothetical protein